TGLQRPAEAGLRGPAAESLISQVRMVGQPEAAADDASTETGLQRPAEAGLRGPAAESLVSQVRMVGQPEAAADDIRVSRGATERVAVELPASGLASNPESTLPSDSSPPDPRGISNSWSCTTGTAAEPFPIRESISEMTSELFAVAAPPDHFEDLFPTRSIAVTAEMVQRRARARRYVVWTMAAMVGILCSAVAVAFWRHARTQSEMARTEAELSGKRAAVFVADVPARQSAQSTPAAASSARVLLRASADGPPRPPAHPLRVEAAAAKSEPSNPKPRSTAVGTQPWRGGSRASKKGVASKASKLSSLPVKRFRARTKRSRSSGVSGHSPRGYKATRPAKGAARKFAAPREL
ncbi:hypothetical protein ACFL5O_02805, partial [Myxococcota bacterium]